MQNSFKISAIVILLLATLALFLLNIVLGPVEIPASDALKTLTGGSSSKETWDYIIINYRLPKAITAMLAGAGLSVSGLMMQTYFRNPLAGPYVLGLTSGSSLGVAIGVMGATYLPDAVSRILLSPYGIIIASCAGSFLVLLAVLMVSRKLRDMMAILIVGLMFGSFTSAIVGVLSYFSSAEQLQKFTFWSLGNLGNLSWSSVSILAILVFSGLLIALFSLKSLDGLLLGEKYAQSLGVDQKKVKYQVIFSTSLIAGSITAFAGPIAFIGLAVPHMARLIFQSSRHQILFWASIILGIMTMLFCDIISQLPGTDTVLPINAITSVIGAPVIVWLLVRKRKMIA